MPKRKDLPKKKSYLLYLKVILTIVLLLLLFVVALYIPNFKKNDEFIEIKEGSTARSIAEYLYQENFILNKYPLLIYLRIMNLDKKIIPGEFIIPKRASAFSIVSIIISSKNIHQYKLTVVEGTNVAQVIKLLNENTILKGKITTKVAEGTLMPDTYHFTKGDTRDSLIIRMQNDMSIYLDNLWSSRNKSLPYKNKREALIMASLIEKEASFKAERETIAAVFINRLVKGMKLQTDPTVAYGLGRENADKLTKKDLKTKHPHNTYIIKGLPPTPIANPSRDSLRAAFFPNNSQYLYFVADGYGGHIFATNLAQHNRNVAKWRIIEKGIRQREKASLN